MASRSRRGRGGEHGGDAKKRERTEAPVRGRGRGGEHDGDAKKRERENGGTGERERERGGAIGLSANPNLKRAEIKN